MAFFSKPEVVLYKDSDNLQAQIDELEQLKEQATGDLKEQINRQIASLKRGENGEDEIMFQLNYAGMNLYVLRDVYIECDGLQAQIDYYVITPKLHIIIECKNLFGNITINQNGDFIRSYQWRGKTVKEGIESPVTQNERHLLVLKNRKVKNAGAIKAKIIEKSFSGYTKSLIVLANSKTILNDRYAPKAVKGKVIRADALVKTIKRMEAESKQPVCNKKEMKEQAESVFAMISERKTDYVSRFREAVALQQAEEKPTEKAETQTVAPSEPPKAEDNTMLCPRCGAMLVEREGKKGKFIGCSSFPKCWYTRQINSEGE